MTNKEAARIYKLYLDNLKHGYTEEDIFNMYYSEKQINPTARDIEYISFKRKIKEAREIGISSYAIVEYLKNLPDEDTTFENVGNILKH